MAEGGQSERAAAGYMLHVNCNLVSVIGGRKILGEVKGNGTRLDPGLTCIFQLLKLMGPEGPRSLTLHCEGIQLFFSLITLFRHNVF